MSLQNTILVTGSAGFIGFALSKKLLEKGIPVVGVDSLNSYYDVQLKLARNAELKKYSHYSFEHLNLCDLESVKSVFKKYQVSRVCHLAAQAGVRYSLQNPFEYQKANLEGFLNILDESKNAKIENFVYASSSSVYGGNTRLPFSEKDPVNHPISLYAATKRANELMAHTYSHLYGIPTTGLRFFTVYGPWGRPDMALFLFTKMILEGKPIEVYNYGNMRRSFTFIDDIVSAVMTCLQTPFPYEIFNLGNDRSASLMEYIGIIEKKLGKSAEKIMMPIQPGDVPETIADLTHAKEKLGFSPKTNIEEGVGRFIDWYRSYYHTRGNT